MAKVLTVDDNDIDRLALVRILKTWGHDVWEADDGAAAMHVLGENTVDIVLLDMSMPDMDGFEMMTLVRQAWSQAELPIIVVTGNDDRKVLADCLARGANDYIIKPISPALIQARLAIHLELLQLRKSIAAAAK